MTQLRIISFHRVGIPFAFGDFIQSPVIPQMVIGFESIAEVVFCLRRIIYHLLDDFLGSVPHHTKTQVTAGETIYDRDDENLFFFSPI